MLVTGASGFVGRQVVRELRAHGHTVVALDRRCGEMPGVTALEGDLADPSLRQRALAGCDAVIHLATVPGGAAETDPGLAWTVNVDTAASLMQAASEERNGMRFVSASSIAVFGDALPCLVDDHTPPRPTMLYGAHKAMMETWLAGLSRRGALQGLSLRLPGIVARPEAGPGFKSAFLSDIFHAARRNCGFTAPVSADATSWIMSVGQAARNLCHAIELPWQHEEPFLATLPATRIRMATLGAELGQQTGRSAEWITYMPDDALEATFGRLPELDASWAISRGFAADESAADLVSDTLLQVARDAQ